MLNVFVKKNERLRGEKRTHLEEDGTKRREES